MNTQPHIARASAAGPALPPPATPELATSAPAASSPNPSVSRGRRGLLWLLLIAVVAVVVFRLFGGEETTDGFSRPPVAVRAVAVTRGDLAISSSYSGELVGEVSDIASQVAGLLRDVPVRIGDRVRQGDVLAVIDDLDLRNQLLEAQGQLRVAEANRKRAEAELRGIDADYARSQELHGQRLISDQEFERIAAQRDTAAANLAASQAQVEQAHARAAILEEKHRDTRILAPFDGTIADRYLDRGALVQAGTPTLRLVEASPLLVQFRVPERDLAAVLPGKTLTLTTQVTRGLAFAGRVQRVSGEVSRSDRTALVEAELTESNEILRPGMFAEVSVRLREIAGALLVPGAAVLERVSMDGTSGSGVFVANSDVASWVPVNVLGRSLEMAAVASDVLVETDLVITMGHTDLDDGSAIRVVAVRPELGSPFPLSNPS